MEYLDIVDEHGEPTGRVEERSVIHEKGLKHRTSHVWLVRYKCGVLQVLLQKRSEEKDSFPGCYDISSAGHIPAGMGFAESALRELQEELSITVSEQDLIWCGDIEISSDTEFHGRPFKDDQYSRVYYLMFDMEAEDMKLQEDEVESVIWKPLKECIDEYYEPEFKHCLLMEELIMLRDSISI